jgi:aspartate/methionine/tyrosine aminotransferase
MSRELLEEIARIAGSVGAYVLCDEVYRHLSHADGWCDSMADLYDRGISVGSMSKVFALAGLRLGWIAARDKDAMRQFMSHRDYNHISCGMLDEAAAAFALEHSDALLSRNRAIVRENLAVLSDWVDAETHVDWQKPQAGTTALVYYDFDIPSYDFCRRMLGETGAFVTPGDCFEEPRSFRIGYACDRETLKNGLAAVSAFLRTLERENG